MGKKMVMRYAILSVLFLSSLAGAYFLGRSHSELKIVEKQVEVIKYVEKKKADIYSKPNATREQLLDLMKNKWLFGAYLGGMLVLWLG